MQRISVKFTDFWHKDDAETVRRENPLYLILARHFDLELSDQPDFLFYSCFGQNHLNHTCVRLFYTAEAIPPRYEECDYAFSFDFPDTERNLRVPLYCLYDTYSELHGLSGFDPEHLRREFCSFITSNPKGTERNEMFDALSRYRPVASGGKHRNNIGGPVADKRLFLQKYKFHVAFENTFYPGYTTEKLMQSFLARTVPIYWGNPRVGVDFNPAALINVHDFASFDAVVDYVHKVDCDDSLYRAYLDASVFPNGRESEYADHGRFVERVRRIFQRSEPQISPTHKRRRNLWQKAINRTRYTLGLENWRA